MYALIVNNSATVVQAALPDSARRQDNGQWVLGLPSASTALQQACGWYAVVDAVRPADTPTTTTDRSIQNVAGTWAVVWTVRNKTPEEITVAVAVANQPVVQANLLQDLIAMQTTIDASNASINSNPATHIKAIARAVRRLVRAATGQYDGTD